MQSHAHITLTSHHIHTHTNVISHTNVTSHTYITLTAHSQHTHSTLTAHSQHTHSTRTCLHTCTSYICHQWGISYIHCACLCVCVSVCLCVGKFHCPVLFKVFNENSHIVAVRPTGNVFSFEVSVQLCLYQWLLKWPQHEDQRLFSQDWLTGHWTSYKDHLFGN